MASDATRAASKRYRDNNKERYVEIQKRYQEKNKEKISARKELNKEKNRAKAKIYRDNNKEMKAAADKKYREKNKEKIRDMDREWRNKNKEKIITYSKSYYRANKKQILARGREYYNDNREMICGKNRARYRLDPQKYLDKAKQWHKENPGRSYNKLHPARFAIMTKKWRESVDHAQYKRDEYLRNKEVHLQRSKQWVQNNRGKWNAYITERRLRRLGAVPAWANITKIKTLYVKCKELNDLWGTNFHVDHYIPLNGDFVCGLHCEDNLQLMDGSLNQSKSNKFSN